MNLFSKEKTAIHQFRTKINHATQPFGKVVFSTIPLEKYAEEIQIRIIECEALKRMGKFGVSDIVKIISNILTELHYSDVDFSSGLSLDEGKMTLDIYARGPDDVRFLELSIPIYKLDYEFDQMVSLVRAYKPESGVELQLGGHGITLTEPLMKRVKRNNPDTDVDGVDRITYSVRQTYKGLRKVKAIFVGTYLIDYVE